MKRQIAISAFALASLSVQAEFYSGNRLYDLLTSTNENQRSVGLGFVIGVHDAHEKVTHCSPDNVTAGQVRDIVLQALSGAPSIRHRNAEQLVWQTLKATWPCPETRPQGRQL